MDHPPRLRSEPSGARQLLQWPLFRLLAANLLAGVAVAVLAVSGLLAVNPMRLRDLIVADQAGGVSLVLLLFGFVITFGSAVMGTAIMAIGRVDEPDEGERQPATVKARRR